MANHHFAGDTLTVASAGPDIQAQDRCSSIFLPLLVDGGSGGQSLCLWEVSLAALSLLPASAEIMPLTRENAQVCPVLRRKNFAARALDARGRSLVTR